MEHLSSVSHIMLENIQAFDEFNGFGDDNVPNDIERSTSHVHLGSHQKLFTIDILEEHHQDNLAFSSLCTHLTKFLRECLPAASIPVGRLVIDDEVCTSRITRHYMLITSQGYRMQIHQGKL